MKSQILVVDDESRVRLALRTRLSRLGCEVVEAENLDQARRLLREHGHRISVVVLDLRLVSGAEEAGEESGLRFLRDESASVHACAECKRLHFSPDVIVLTAFASVPSCRAAFLAGITDYLDKNDTNVWKALEARVRDALASDRTDALHLSQRWFEDHFDEVLARYGGQVVALRGEEILAASAAVGQVRAALRERGVRDEDCLLVAVPKG